MRASIAHSDITLSKRAGKGLWRYFIFWASKVRIIQIVHDSIQLTTQRESSMRVATTILLASLTFPTSASSDDPGTPNVPAATNKELNDAYKERLNERRSIALETRRNKYAGRRHVYPIYAPGVRPSNGFGRQILPVYLGSPVMRSTYATSSGGAVSNCRPSRQQQLAAHYGFRR